MKIAIILLLFCSSSLVHAGEWDDQVDRYINIYKQSAESPKPIAYPELGERVRNVFRLNIKNHILIRRVKSNGTETSTDLFYGNGELHILQNGEGWNMFTKGDYIYEWKIGEKVALKSKKNEKDLVDYILYLTDPSYIMTSLYNDYTKQPDNFNVLESNGKTGKEITLKSPLYGFEAIFVNEESLWFYGFRSANAKSGIKTSIYFSKPVIYEVLPKELIGMSETIEFRESDTTVKRHMVYM
ncbi:MAG: hypothetical protein Q7U10_08055 [Thermodesulfovibrionia bacterium]|nr:hypothetical protein [Thermodesulfovibrionia bacterium]